MIGHMQSSVANIKPCVDRGVLNAPIPGSFLMSKTGKKWTQLSAAR